MDFLLVGRFQPYTRMTQRSKFADPRAKEYLASKQVLGLQFSQQMTRNKWKILPGQTPLDVKIEIISSDGHRCDLDNQVKGLLDAAQTIVFPDDRWVDRITARRRSDGKRYEARFRVEVIE